MGSVNFANGKIYGVLRASVIADNGEHHSHRSGQSHYNLLTIINEQSQPSEMYQINIDIQSLPMANVKCISIDPFTCSTMKLSSIPFGFTPLESNVDDTLALDFIRRPIFDLNLLTQSTALTAEEIAAKLDVYFYNKKPHIIVFGTMYDDEHVLQANHYGLERAKRENKPSRGIDDIHMNQIIGKDGHAFQDGALFIQNDNQDEYIGFFFCFNSQCT